MTFKQLQPLSVICKNKQFYYQFDQNTLCFAYKRIQDSRIAMKGNKFLQNCFCDDHPYEKLNLVCTMSTCPKKGLICSLCKLDPYSLDNPHEGHQSKIVPFRFLIQSLESSFDNFKEFEKDRYLSVYLQKLEMLRDESLVTNMSAYIEKLEQTVLERFETARSSIISREETLKKFKKVINKTTIHNIRKEEKYQLINEMRSMIGFIRQNEGQGRSRFALNLDPNAILAKAIQDREKLKLNCQTLEFNLRNMQKNEFEIKCWQQSASMKKELRAMKRMMQMDQKQQKEIESPTDNNKNIELKQTIQPKVEEAPSQSKIHYKHKKQHKSKNLLADLDEQAVSKISKPPKQNSSDYTKLQDSYQQKVNVAFQAEENKEKSKKSAKMFQLLANFQKKAEENSHEIVFSSFYKNAAIKLTKFGKSAKQTMDSGLVLVSESLDTCNQISLKIARIKLSILVGVAYSDIVAEHQCSSVNYKVANHGIVGVDHSGLCLYHGKPEQNNIKKNFHFQEHDILNLKYDKKVLWIERSGGKKHKETELIEIPFKGEGAGLKNIYFCVYLAGKDDSIQIL